VLLARINEILPAVGKGGELFTSTPGGTTQLGAALEVARDEIRRLLSADADAEKRRAEELEQKQSRGRAARGRV
jgi:hypothetical protein